MLDQGAHSHTNLNGIQQQNVLSHSNTVQVHRNQDSSPCHDLACLEEQDNDTYMKLYDVANPPCKCKRNIPEFVYHNKFQSNDYVNCVRQNGTNYSFLPLNNLMVFTGEEVIWAKFPSVIEAPKIIRTSARPNFMGVKIPVASQLNIDAWKAYLVRYWDKQIVNLLQYGFPLDFDCSRVLEST